MLTRQAIVLPARSPFSFWSKADTLTLHVPLLYSYIARTGPIEARVELGRKDGWKSLGTGEGRELSVLSATLVGALKHHGIRCGLIPQ